ncbi:glycosyltransferase family 2 protein [Escherichia coli]|uniref:glycosyltransferase family 2 protein n=1 Tax=Escherichia coli TaxID=562 RepID=UPI001EEB52CF|nr:glycosyltransferase family 2 protein [Escherichia coli]
MTVFISVVSHGHAEIIKKLDCLASLATIFKVVIKCNKSGDAELLSEYENCQNIHILNEAYGLGFGKNNNYVFDYCLKHLGMNENDYFIVLNPDVKIHLKTLEKLIRIMNIDDSRLASINLYINSEMTIFDNSVRKFPRFIDFVSSFVLKKNNVIYDKKKLSVPVNVEWAAGSFLAFKVSHYALLNGFSDKYFMYCEDIDICYRSHLYNVPVRYYPEVKAIHFAKHANRSIFSKHFWWHVSSIVKFLYFKYNNRIER